MWRLALAGHLTGHSIRQMTGDPEAADDKFRGVLMSGFFSSKRHDPPWASAAISPITQ
jgi:hypothetical protein